ncbi:formate dehydrogenase subunit gamma [Indioceanicola profundi]|uniref:formate dehydrogenase subunit gamma n=1 Tax=Indioceanicola profundi TaxID=2220096 RepID=UPI000E6AB8CA|nr:formate dehydrogenase subunit gamma [Indioceanicola profundi]
MTRRLLILLTAALLAVASPVPQSAIAQETAQGNDIGGGAGRDVNAPVSPGLESRTPSDRFQSPDDVELYVPHNDQVMGRVSIPNYSLAMVVQPEGRTWRAYRMDWLFWIAGAAIIGMLALLTIFFLWRGRIRIEHGRSGRWVPRFNGLDRFAHWMTAISFVLLALTGLVITFGRPLLLPLLGHSAFGDLAGASALIHTISSVPFVLGLVLMLVLWIRDNIPEKADIAWIKSAGGILASGKGVHLEAGRFNAGQKILFWGVIFLGLSIALSGFLMMVPLYWTGVSGMQIIHVIHSLLAAAMMAMILGHIYIGTLGMEGAFDAMGRGEVDENWAIEHHRGWYNEQRKAGAVRGDVQPGASVAGAD